jgi:hypothetical protein
MASASPGQASRTILQSRREVSEHLVPVRDQGEELAHDRIGSSRPGQAALEIAQSGRLILVLNGDRAQV